MELTTILNHCHHQRGFVYQHARFGPDKNTVEVAVRPRQGTAAICSGCQKPAPGNDHLPERRFEFIPFWFPGAMANTSPPRLTCSSWPAGRASSPGRKAFRTSWDRVCDAVEYVVGWGLKHRTLESIRAIGVDEIQYAKGHKYLTLVYHIDQGITRLLWVGFQGFFTVIGENWPRRSSSSARTCGSPTWTSSARNARKP